MEHHELIGTMKSQLWEDAKGKLRALVAVSGSVSSYGPDPTCQRDKWPKLESLLDQFIKDVEDNGLQE